MSHTTVDCNNTIFAYICAVVVLFIVLFNSKFNSQLIRHNKNKLNPSFDLFFFSSIIFIILCYMFSIRCLASNLRFLSYEYTALLHTACFIINTMEKLYETKLEDLNKVLFSVFCSCFFRSIL